MEEFKENCKKLKETCFVGEVTLTKASLWMIAGLFLLAGIIRGLRMAPMTHGVMIGCGNGNGSGFEARGCGSGNGAETRGCGNGSGAGKRGQGKEAEKCGCRKAGKKRREKGHR